VTTVGQEAIQSFGELSGKKSSQPIDGSSKNRTQDIILSPEHPEPFWTLTRLCSNEVRSIGVWAAITLAVCVVADPLIELGIVGG
jgi:hypothetical protein